MYRKFLSLLKNITVSFEKMINFLTTQEHNPLYFHGAIPLYVFGSSFSQVFYYGCITFRH